MTLGQCVGLSFFSFLVKNIIEWWVPNVWGLGNWGILSDEWWVTKIEWGVMSDEKKKKNQTALKYLLEI